MHNANGSQFVNLFDDNGTRHACCAVSMSANAVNRQHIAGRNIHKGLSMRSLSVDTSAGASH